MITEPGVYDIPEDEYHADPVPGGSLSSSGARRLMATCPAKFQHERTHRRPDKKEFDIGKAAHKIVLGNGPTLARIDFDEWRSNAAKAAVAEARDAGAIPLKPAEYEQVHDMAAALRAHPTASRLFDPARGGRAEQSGFWRDRRTGVWRRVRWDWLPPKPQAGRLIIPDYKTCVSAEPEAIKKAVYKHGYHQQDDWYREAAYELGLVGPGGAAFVFVFQEKEAPYLITIVELDQEAQTWGAALNDRAIDVFRQCNATGMWPGYSTDVIPISLPPYAIKQYEIAQQMGALDLQERIA